MRKNHAPSYVDKIADKLCIDRKVFGIEREKVTSELRAFAEEHDKNFDWDREGQKYYYITFTTTSKGYGINITTLDKIEGAIYFSSEKLAIQAVKQVGKKRISIYRFGAYNG